MDDLRVMLVSNKKFVYNGSKCYMMNIRDLTQHYKLQQVVEERNNIKMLNSTVTHEMMTPLNCVTSFADRLVSLLKDKKQRSYAVLISRTSKLLKSYIRDLLDRNLLEKGKLELNFQHAVLEELFAELVEMMQYQAQMRGITIDCKLTGPLGKFSIDAQRVTQILINLVSNAVKFSPEEGTINLGLHVQDIA